MTQFYEFLRRGPLLWIVMNSVFIVGCGEQSAQTTKPNASGVTPETNGDTDDSPVKHAEVDPKDIIPFHGGKSFVAWIAQAESGYSLENRQDALQVLRNVGLAHDREKTLAAFAKALSDKEPTIQSLAAAGLRKAGRPTDPLALPRLVELISHDLTDTPTNELGVPMRAISALESVGEKAQIPALRKVAQTNPQLRRLAEQAIQKIESRSAEKKE